MRKEDLENTQPHHINNTFKLPKIGDASFGEKVAPVHMDGTPFPEPFRVVRVIVQMKRVYFGDPAETQKRKARMTQPTHRTEGAGTLVVSDSKLIHATIFDAHTKYRPGDVYCK